MDGHTEQIALIERAARSAESVFQAIAESAAELPPEYRGHFLSLVRSDPGKAFDILMKAADVTAAPELERMTREMFVRMVPSWDGQPVDIVMEEVRFLPAKEQPGEASA